MIGSAYIFERDGSGYWNEVQKLVASDRAKYDFFGGSVSISDNYAIVGAIHEKEDASGGNTIIGAGSAYIFERDGSGYWNEVQKIVASDRAYIDHFGGSVSISDNYAIVSAINEDEDASGGNTLEDAGSAYIFKRDGNGVWNEVQNISPIEGDYFGSSVGLSGDYAVVGNLEKSHLCFDEGFVTLFESCTPVNEAEPENIIDNGDFESCILDPWAPYLYIPSVNTMNAVIFNGECYLTGITIADDPQIWHVQMSQTFTQEQKDKLETGTGYELSFSMAAEAEYRVFNVFLGQNDVSNLVTILDEDLVVGVEPENFSFSFNVASVPSVVRLIFNIGNETTELVLDSVKLVKTTGNSITQHIHSEGVRVMPNPANDFILVKAEECSIVSLYNSLGILVKETTFGNGNVQLDVSDLVKGVYLLEISNGSAITIEKVIVQ